MMLRWAPLHLATPAAILTAAYMLVPHVGALPSSLIGLKIYGPYLLLALGIAVSIAFQRGRALFALLTLAAAHLGHQLYLQAGSPASTAYTAFAALCVFVPFNLAALSLLRERGIFNAHGVQRTVVLLAQLAFAAWVLRSGKMGFAAWVYASLVETRLFATSPVPQLGLVALALSFSIALTVWSIKRSTIDLGLAGAVIAFALAVNGVTSSNAFETFIAAGALILTVAVMQDTFRMAFRDELTGLPSRRALNERLASLGRRYTVAMLDVDRFKGLNDRFGHDVGDQVLKMVGARLVRVGGGGKVYRYGGEEFTVVFSGKSVAEALPHLEALREDIANYQLALRDPERVEQPKSAGKVRGAGTTGRAVAVTISIGVAESDERLTTPEDVIQAADKALYRAKNRGRNQVSR
jgi:diguanylate cyclase (GGDEF)-like protein